MSAPRSVAWLAVAAITGCSHPHDVVASYAGTPAPAGAVDVVLNNPSGALSVTINDALVVDRKHSRKAHVDGIPAGIARIHVAAGGGCEQGVEYDREVEIVPGATTTLALAGPELSTSCAIYEGLFYVGVNIGIAAIAIAMTAAAKTVRIAHMK